MFNDFKTATDRVGKYRKNYLGLVFILLAGLLIATIIYG